jgi:ketosteroid isomerase-like protein
MAAAHWEPIRREGVDSVSDESEIRRAVEEFVVAYNAGKLDDIVNIFADDLVDMSAGDPTRTGEAAKRQFLSRVSKTHSNFKPTLTIHIDELRVAGEWAFQRGSLSVSLVPKEGGPTSFIKQRYLEIWRRNLQGKWKIAIEMDNSAEA